MKKIFLSLALLGGFASAAPLSLTLSVTDGTKPLVGPLTLPSGGSLNVSEVKLYVSHVALIKADGREVLVRGLTLTKLSSQTGFQNVRIFMGNAPVGEYRGVRFDVGVPRDQNHLDATSAPSPLSIEDGMYWAWNSGYIFMSVLGKTSVAGSEKDVALHVGGDNHRVTVNLADLQKPSTALSVGPQGASVPVTLNLAALLSKGLDGAAWDFSQPQYQQVHMGKVADQLADNARSAFEAGK